MNLKSNLMWTTEPAARRRWLDTGHRMHHRTCTCGTSYSPARNRSVKRRGLPVWRHEYLQAMREANRVVLRHLNRGDS